MLLGGLVALWRTHNTTRPRICNLKLHINLASMQVSDFSTAVLEYRTNYYIFIMTLCGPESTQLTNFCDDAALVR